MEWKAKLLFCSETYVGKRGKMDEFVKGVTALEQASFVEQIVPSIWQSYCNSINLCCKLERGSKCGRTRRSYDQKGRLYSLLPVPNIGSAGQISRLCSADETIDSRFLLVCLIFFEISLEFILVRVQFCQLINSSTNQSRDVRGEQFMLVYSS